MTIARVIAEQNGEVIHCAPESTVQEAARLLAENRIGAVPVLENGKVVGIFSERDLLYCVARDAAVGLLHDVRKVMTGPAITVGPDTDALEALALMTRRRIRHLPVIENDEMIAFVSIGDLVKYRMGQIEGEAKAMREYITTA
ncbi:CBS domain-containing protein [Altererythrobacter atlanticus]|uniref:Inosine-5'-monophosphate dehydrogenase n=1 Tax=Croceibacterium atlanticum TaxID=1267766 RepID=A0A0F7KUM4_9SPHN|nr:CBS domain-containing protein [Croceibacterium atlanticum]AKH43319.1 Inosine-5'-monophosphate dehydrogenase [Croceibacterium atlanticum]MBB5731975.1 CBS domain-containing protein [Croceibacterium atlanticum]